MKKIDILREIKHRTYPMPEGPWVMKQSWHELLFAHWPIKPAALRVLLPSFLEIDTFEGECWVGVVPFRMSGVRPRGLPAIAPLSNFPELNVRTYVTVNGIPGVYFFSLDASNPVAVFLARRLFHLPYFTARMSCTKIGDTIHYSSVRTHKHAASAEFTGCYRPIEEVVEAKNSSIEEWLTERYALYTTVGKHVYRGDIHHIRWPLQIAEYAVEKNTMAESHGIILPDTEPLLHYAARQDVFVWPIQQVV